MDIIDIVIYVSVLVFIAGVSCGISRFVSTIFESYVKDIVKKELDSGVKV
jgi:hypothetical protein